MNTGSSRYTAYASSVTPPPTEKRQKARGTTLFRSRPVALAFSARSPSPMNFPEGPARSPSRSWLSSRCLRRARRRCPRNFLTCLTARSVMAGWASSLGHTLSDFGGVMQHLHGLRATGHDREHQRPLAAGHAVDAAGRSPRVAAPSARAGVVGHAALEDEDLLVPEVAVARDRGARVVAHQHRLPVPFLPEDLPVDAWP